MRLARPVPDLCTPARMPRAGPCQPIREAAARVSDSAVVTPGCIRSSTGQREDWASLSAWARWVHARCMARGVGRLVAAVGLSQRSAGGLVAGMRVSWGLGLPRGACSLEALAGDVVPAVLQMKRIQGAG